MRLDAHEAAGACLERENGEEKDLRHGESDQSGLRRAQNDKQCAAGEAPDKHMRLGHWRIRRVQLCAFSPLPSLRP